jgi:PLD-like domain
MGAPLNGNPGTSGDSQALGGLMSILTTWSKPNGAICTEFRDQLVEYLKKDKSSKILNMYFYAITKAGWDDIWPYIKIWKAKNNTRAVFIYCGLANSVTDPRALAEMLKLLPNHSFLVTKRPPVFHPKAFIFYEKNHATCFIGSNNLSGPGLGSNYELGVVIRHTKAELATPNGLIKWEKAVKSVAKPLTNQLLSMYKEEYDKMARLPRNPGVVGKKRASNLQVASAAGLPLPGTAILEVMPKETGSGGSQLQIPKAVAEAFFSLPSGGQMSIQLLDNKTKNNSTLTFTDYGNNTRRLCINRLAVEPRPCVIWFKRKQNTYIFDIASQESNPREYDRLLLLCTFQTNSTSKRWGMYEDDAEIPLI